MFWINCLFVFFLMFLTDVIWTAYFRYLADKKALASAISGTVIYLLSATVTVKWVEDPWYLAPAMLGAFLGTFVTVKVMK